MNIKTQIAAALTSGAVMLSVATPMAFAANTNVLISGNGVGSNNNVNYWMNSTKVVMQQNSAFFFNAVNSNANTGNNSANFNTGGSTGISTGVVNSNTGVNNQANSNQVVNMNGMNVVPAMLNVAVTGNGAGSNNNVNSGSNSSKVVSQSNGAVITNVVTNNANTGNNGVNFNTGGSTGISTGGSNSNVGISNQANSNIVQH